ILLHPRCIQPAIKYSLRTDERMCFSCYLEPEQFLVEDRVRAGTTVVNIHQA
uniref:DNA-directed RNA polymerase n=1 Tax=Haemonchus contortus TaxID=6289 RepID=A0A7I4YJR4_HAECO